jgi:superfamily I DNA and/or RNA helicase
MRPAISVFPSNSFYGGEIQDGPNVTAPNYNTRMSLMKNAGYQFVQVNGIESQGHTGSYQNITEAKVVVDLLVELCNMARMQQSGRGWSAVDRIRVITFYQAQVTLIKSMLRGRGRGLDGVVVSTVDSSQGCEADVVIVTFVRSANKDGNRVGFLSDNRRLNVALTRAKFQMICVGNANGMLRLDHAPTIQALAKDAQTRDCITNYRPILTEYRADIHKRIHGPGRNDNKNKRDRNQKMMKQPIVGGERENAGGNAGSKNNTGRKQRRQDNRRNSTSNEHHAKRVKQAPPH